MEMFAIIALCLVILPAILLLADSRKKQKLENKRKETLAKEAAEKAQEEKERILRLQREKKRAQSGRVYSTEIGIGRFETLTKNIRTVFNYIKDLELKRRGLSLVNKVVSRNQEPGPEQYKFRLAMVKGLPALGRAAQTYALDPTDVNRSGLIHALESIEAQLSCSGNIISDEDLADACKDGSAQVLNATSEKQTEEVTV